MPSDLKQKREYVTATATRDSTPQVGLILSSYQGGQEMDGRKIRALRHPCPVDAPLSGDQLDDMLGLALELSGGRRGGLRGAITPDDWVLIKAAKLTDPNLIRGVLQRLVEQRLGKRFSIAGGGDRALIKDFSERHPSLQFELVNLDLDPKLSMPVEGRVCARNNPSGVYQVPKVLRQCDKLISIAPLQTHPATGVALSLMNYYDFAYPKDRLEQLGSSGEVALDLFSFHPADFSILGGPQAIEGNGEARRHNAIIAGPGALAVDAIGAAVMGFDPTKLRHLDLAVRHGYGVNDADTIWTRGNELAQARTQFRKPTPAPSAARSG